MTTKTTRCAGIAVVAAATLTVGADAIPPELAFEASWAYVLGDDEGVEFALGDMDGDADLDLVATLEDELRVYVNRGDGHFELHDTRFAQPGAKHVLLSDVDGDEDLDAIVVSWTISVHLNDGAGQLPLAQVVTTPALEPPGFLADARGDGVLDLFVVGPDGLYVSEAVGDGTFGAAAKVLNHVAGRVTLDVGDATGDSIADVLVRRVDGSISQFEVWVGDASNQYAPNATALAQSPTEVGIFGDINDDGHMDVVTSRPIEVYLGDGGGVYAGPADAAASINSALRGVFDVDGDGVGELVAASCGSEWFEWTGGPTLGEAGALAPGCPIALAIGDVTGDGEPDCVARMEDAGIVSVTPLVGGAPMMSSYFESDGYSGIYPEIDGVALGDVDHDGRVDFVSVGAGGVIVSHLNTGTGFVQAYHFENHHVEPIDVRLAHIDGAPGSSPSLVNVTQHAALQVRFNADDGVFGPAISDTWTASNSIAELDIGDIDGDGVADAVVAKENGKFGVFLRQGGWIEQGPTWNMPIGTVREMLLADLDCDGELDVVHGGANGLAVRRGLGAGPLGNPTFGAASSFGAEFDLRTMKMGDLNQDGVLDIVATETTSSPRLLVFLGTSGAGFDPRLDLSMEIEFKGFALDDFDGDGVLDVFGTDERLGYLLRGLGNGGFESVHLPVLIGPIWGVGAEVADSADFDGDAAVDVLLARRHGDLLALRNRMSASAYVPPVCPCAGDLNGDRSVDVLDFGLFASAFGTTSGATAEDGDFDGDGDVDVFDFDDFIAAFGSGCP